mgnify:FL=1
MLTSRRVDRWLCPGGKAARECVSQIAQYDSVTDILSPWQMLVKSYSVEGAQSVALRRTISDRRIPVPLQAINFASDLKLGHYMKVISALGSINSQLSFAPQLPPRLVFIAQLVCTIISALVAIGVTDWQIKNIEGICTLTQKDRFYCLSNRCVRLAFVPRELLTVSLSPESSSLRV